MQRLSRRGSIKKKYFRQKLISYLILGLIGFSIFSFFILFVLFAWFAKDLPSPGKIQRVSGFSTIFYDREDKVIYEMYKDKNRIPVNIKNIPDTLKKATIAIEDKDFYKHQGFSIKGIVRAVLKILFRGKLEGGSTLTQQLVKNALLTPERSIVRKIKEFVLSVSIEKKFSKDQILEMYLNESPYGGTFWGVESAAKGYFDKSTNELDLIESAILAGLPQRPSYYSPFIGKSGAYIDRTKDVLRRMKQERYITEEEEKKALSKLKQVKFSSPHFAFHAPHFVFYIKDQVSKLFGEEVINQGFKIKTTLSLEVQKIVENIVKEEIEKIKNLNATNAAVVVLDSQTGEILAMVGSYDYNNEKFGKYNTALAKRQPGSSIKPITYALAFEKGYTPATVLMDVKTVFANQGEKDYIPENYNGKFRGPVQLRFALGNSINIPTVKLLAMVGLREFLQKSYDMSLETLEPTDKNLKRFGLSITLGGGEVRLLDLTSAFSVFARCGVKKDYSSILELKSYKDKTLAIPKPQPEKRVLGEGASFLISHILSDNNARIDVFGPRSYLNIPGKKTAVKTGTTNDKRDNWTIGYTNSITVGVWVGNNDNSPMSPKIASGATGASPIWHRIIIELLRKYPDGICQKPENVEALEIDADFGGLPNGSNPKRSEYFIKGTEPKDISSFYKKLKISKNNGKLANDIEIRLGEYEEKDFIVIIEKDPVSIDGINRWQIGIDEWANSQTDSKFKAPKDISDTKADDIIIQIKEPPDQAVLNTNNITIKAKIISLKPIKKVEIYANNTVVFTFDEDKKTIEEPLKLSDGVYEIKIRAKNSDDKSAESKISIGINQPIISPTPVLTLTPTITPTP